MKILILLTGILGAFVSNAIQLSDNHEGDALIIPFFTVENDHKSVLNINNNTDSVKAIRVKILERFMQRDTLTFNVYLAPFDDYSFDIEATVSTVGGHAGEPSARILFTDNSCAPYLNSGQEVLPFSFDNIDQAYDTDMDRTQIGVIEVIDMGVVVDPEAQNIIHTNGVPNDCNQIQSNWSGGGVWDTQSAGDPEFSISSISGGISASLGVINVNTGSVFNIEAILFNNTLNQDIYHEAPGSPTPVIYNDLTDSLVEVEGDLVTVNWNGFDPDNITALIQKTSITAEFDFTQALNSDINWVVSLLNKKAYVGIFGPDPIVPFLHPLTVEDQGACDELVVEVRDELGELLNPVLNENFSLCESVNVIPVKSFGEQPVLILDDSYRSYINVGFLDAGTITIKTKPENVIDGFDVLNPTEYYYSYGLPIEGFQLTRLDDGVNPPQYQTQEFIATNRLVSDLIFNNGLE